MTFGSEIIPPRLLDTESSLLPPVRSARGSVGYFLNHLTGDNNEH